MPVQNMFETAKVVEKKTATKAKEEVIVEVEGLEELATVDSLIGALEGIRVVFEEQVKSYATEYFVTEGARVADIPKNFKGVEGDAKASIQLRKRSSRSALNEIQQELLKKYGISTETVSDMPETFIFNPDKEVQEWVLKNGAEISKRLAGIKGCPENLLMKQNATTKVVTTANSMKEMFKLPIAAIRELIGVVGCVTCAPKLVQDDDVPVDPSNLIDRMYDLLGVEKKK